MPCHRSYTHTVLDNIWWRWPGMSINMPCCVDGDNTCCHPCPHCSRWATWHSSPSIHMRSRCPVTVSDMATNGGWRMTNYSQGEPSHCPLSFIFSHEKQVPCWPTMEQPQGTTTTQDDNDMTSQLLLPCQLTCALPSWGVHVVYDPWMYPSWVKNLWNSMYTLTRTCRLPWPMSRVQVYVIVKWPRVTHADDYCSSISFSSPSAIVLPPMPPSPLPLPFHAFLPAASSSWPSAS